jgi:hypothetical protein
LLMDSTADYGTVEHARVRTTPDGRMTREDAATYLGIATKTLAAWKVIGKGPPCVRIGWRQFYFKRDLDAYIRRG